MRTRSNIIDYPFSPMISGAMAAVVMALLFFVATVGALIVGVWSSGTMEGSLFCL